MFTLALMPFTDWVYLVVYTIYAITILGTIVIVITENRNPVKSLAWVIVLTFLPVVGLVFYIFFGQNFKAKRMVSRRIKRKLRKRDYHSIVNIDELPLNEESKQEIKLCHSLCSMPYYSGNRVKIFTTGQSKFDQYLQDLEAAREYIHIQYYIFEDDKLGSRVKEVLLRCARRGVQIRVLYDDVGCWNVPNSFFEQMRNAGIDVHAFMPVKFPAFTSKVNYRNHRKLCVIDGKIGYIGGMNVAMRYVKGSNGRAWRDTHMRIRGGAVYGIQRAFLVDWFFVDRTLVTNRCYYPMLDGNINNDCIMQVVTSSPISPWPEMMQGYVRILLEAKRYVYMETPYFLPTEPVMFAMRTAALAGVDVRLMVPLHSDAKFVEWASRPYIQEAADSGVKVYLYKAGFNHSKLLVSDDSLSTCGSTNIDFRSFENNFESNVFIYDSGMAQRVKAVFIGDMKNCVMYGDYMRTRRLSFTHRLWESFVRLFSPLM